MLPFVLVLEHFAPRLILKGREVEIAISFEKIDFVFLRVNSDFLHLPPNSLSKQIITALQKHNFKGLKRYATKFNLS